MKLLFWELLQSLALLFAKQSLPLIHNAKTRRFIESRNSAEVRAALVTTKRAFELRDAQHGKPLRKVWLHVSSAGELEQAIPPMRKLVCRESLRSH